MQIIILSLLGKRSLSPLNIILGWKIFQYLDAFSSRQQPLDKLV
jgi:hypothetical protein